VTTPVPAPLPDLTATVLRALLLYSLAEHQSGQASTIRVTAEGTSFSLSDDGRGHPIDKTVEGTSYLAFVYTHLDYPFPAGRSAPVQLQGIGMSLVNALCSELRLQVNKRDAELELLFAQGQLVQRTRRELASEQTGIQVSGRIAPGLGSAPADLAGLEQWLRAVLATAPALRLFFNGRALQPSAQGAGLDETPAG
jgi:DNA gyrase/topoisomerase IV subunit B